MLNWLAANIDSKNIYNRIGFGITRIVDVRDQYLVVGGKLISVCEYKGIVLCDNNYYFEVCGTSVISYFVNCLSSRIDNCVYTMVNNRIVPSLVCKEDPRYTNLSAIGIDTRHLILFLDGTDRTINIVPDDIYYLRGTDVIKKWLYSDN